MVPFKVNAATYFDNYIVMDMGSKRIFYEKGKDIPKLPASTTKIMTAIVAIENTNLEDIATVGKEILTIDGTNIYSEIGEHIMVQDLLYGMMLRSGNDAAMTLAAHTSGNVSNFVKLMNEKARILKLKNTTFNNPTGLDDYEKNTSTVYDLGLLYSYAYKNPTFRKIVGTKSYEMKSDKKSYYFNNRMKLLSMYDKATGGKTGYTPSAGYILVSSASNQNLDLVAVTIGNSYGFESHINFYEDVFNSYKNYVVLDKEKYTTSKKFDSKPYIKNSFSYPLTNEEKDKIEKKEVFNKKKSGNVGKVLVYLNDDLIHEEKIYVKENKVSFTDKIKLFFKNLVD